MSQISSNFSGIHPIKNTPAICSLIYLTNRYKDSIAPEEFQRPESWDDSDKTNYFNSLLMNRTESLAVFVDVVSAIEKLKILAPNNRACKYFEYWKSQGYGYLILDANNRFKFCTSLLNDGWTIPTGQYWYVNDGGVFSLNITPANNKFSLLSDAIRRLIEERQMIVSVYTQIDYKGLSEVFLNVNSGVPLNPQEKRNAFGTEWADYVRKLRNNNSDLMTKIHGQKHMCRLDSDNWIADALCFIRNVSADDVSGITQNTKDTLYRNEFIEEEVEYITNNFTRLNSYIDRVILEQILDRKVITRASSCMNLLWMMCNGIDTYDDAVQAVKFHERYYQDRDTLMNENGCNYNWACGSLGFENNRIRMGVLTDIIKEIKSRSFMRV